MTSYDTSVLDAGDTAWVLISTALVMFMIPGLGYFYAGLAQHKNALSLIFFSMISLSVVSVQWFLFGFSLSFADSTNIFIGNFQHGMFIDFFNPSMAMSGTIPMSVFAVYQGMFAAITPALAFGGAAERIRVVPTILFIFVWSTLVYDFEAYWTWGGEGWMHKIGGLDYAGGTPVHIASGAAALAFSLVLGKRDGFGSKDFKPHSLQTVFLGTSILWFGWFGFNGGAGVAANNQAGVAIANTNLSASIGGFTWILIDYIQTKRLSAFGYCSGVIAGLVSITPAAGYTLPYYAPIFGIVGAIGCHYAIELKVKLGYDDALDAFGVHGVGGMIGNILLGIFATDDFTAEGGAVSGNPRLIGIQIATTIAGFTWSFLMTVIILFAMNLVPALRMRLDADEEIMGTDKAQMGEAADLHFEDMVQEVTIKSAARLKSLAEDQPVMRSRLESPASNNPHKPQDTAEQN